MPLPWSATTPAFGFSPTGASWLPQPAQWAALARDAQLDDPGSTLSLYRALLDARKDNELGSGTLEWLTVFPAGVLAFRNGNVAVVANIGSTPIALPHGEVIVTSGPIIDGELPVDTAVWLERTGA